MAPPTWKGKRPGRFNNAEPTERPIPPSAYIQAYEAQLVYNQHETAKELATKAEYLPESSRNRGRGLIRWQGDEEADIWADRHDMIHLLSALPAAGPSRNTMRTPSPAATSSSWDSLPSDADETFSLSGSEDYEEYEREKKQRWIAALREERLHEREKEDVAASNAHPPTSASASSSWPEDEEPPEAILTLMKHTAKSISTSPNPQLLEMRILANHASDDRFAFLRGRWPEAWESVKERLRRLKMNDPERKKKEEKAVGALLGGYESSDDEEEGQEGPGDEDEEGIPPPPPPTEEDGLPPPPPSPRDGGHSVPQEQTSDAGIIGETVGEDRDARSRVEETDEEEKKRLRRLKVEEWKRQRAEAKANTLS